MLTESNVTGAAVAPSEQGTHRLVVRSIGTANPRIRSALAEVLPYAPADVARRLYHAPQELLGGLRKETAERMAALLESSGLEMAVLSKDEPLAAGRGDHEIALAVKDVARLGEIVALVAELLEMDIAEASRRVWASPAVLMANVSEATVEALRRRFAPLGAMLDVSCPKQAVFDAFLGECDPAIRALVERAVREVAPALAAGPAADSASGPVVAAGLTEAQAAALWERVSRSGAPLRLLNRDFQRFDVRLDSAPATNEMFEHLVASTGMPRVVAEKLPGKVPVVLKRSVTHAEAAACLAELVRVGARASAHLLTFQTFALVIEELGETAATTRLLRAGAGVGPDQAMSAIARLPATIPGPFTSLRAHWLVGELKKVGTRARLLVR